MRRDESIRQRLLTWLLVPLGVLLFASAVTAYHLTLRAATEAYDRALLDPAVAIASRLRTQGGLTVLDVPPDVLEMLSVDSVDRTFFSVVRPDGTVLAGQADLPAPPELPAVGTTVHYDASYRGEPVRAAALRVPRADGSALVVVAETTLKRNRLLRQVLLSTALPEVLFLLLTAALVWHGVARGLAPLDELRAELAARSHRDLRAVPEEQAPREVRPVVHELNELLARLADSMENQQRFVANAAHQLRTPLAALQAQVESMRRERAAGKGDADLERLHAATRRIAHLAHQLLALARVEPGGVERLPPQPADLAALVAEAVDDWIGSADRGRIDIGFELEPARVLGEPFLLRELLANLVDNALRYTPSGGSVTVRTGVRDGVSFADVEDTGPGIPPAERERVFERFYRVKGAGGEGTGLGLAIVREIALRHGAQARVVTPASGSGTLVEVRFPSGGVRAAAAA